MKFVGSTSGITVRYWAKQNTPPVASRYISAHVHPIRPKIAHQLAHRDQDTLWWRVSVNQLLPYKRVVRSWCARRVRIAFEEALRHQGLDKLGKRLADSPMSKGNRNFKGTMEVYIQQQCVTQSFEEIQKDATQLVSDLLASQSAQV